MIKKFWELTVFAAEAVVHKGSAKWPERPATLLKRDSNAQVFSCEICEFFKSNWWLGCFCSQTDQKKRKDILRKDIYKCFC